MECSSMTPVKAVAKMITERPIKPTAAKCKLPFQYTDSTYSRGKRPLLGLFDLLLRLVILVIQVFIIQILERLTGRSAPKRQRLVNGKSAKFVNGKHR